MGLATIGMQHMAEGATEYNEWTQRIIADVGDLVDWVAKGSNQKPEDVLREVRGYAEAALKSEAGFNIAPVSAPKKKAEVAIDRGSRAHYQRTGYTGGVSA